MMRLAVATFFFFFFNDTATTEIYTLSLHDALPISPARAGQPRYTRGSQGRNRGRSRRSGRAPIPAGCGRSGSRSEEHTSELQSQSNLVCRLLLEKKKKKQQPADRTLRLRRNLPQPA